jgi:hypothetical protein
MTVSLESLVNRLNEVPDDFAEIKDGVRKAVQVASLDPDMALTRVRKVLEHVVRDIYQRRCKEDPGTRPLENLLQRLVKDGHLPGKLDAYASAVRKLGNVGTHSFRAFGKNGNYGPPKNRKQIMPQAKRTNASWISVRRSRRRRRRPNECNQEIVRSTNQRNTPSPLPCSV